MIFKSGGNGGSLNPEALGLSAATYSCRVHTVAITDTVCLVRMLEQSIPDEDMKGKKHTDTMIHIRNTIV